MKHTLSEKIAQLEPITAEEYESTDYEVPESYIEKSASANSGAEYQDGIQLQPSGRIYPVLCHIAAPLIWPWKRKTSEAVDLHGKAALNHMISSAGLFIALHVILGLAAKLSLIPVDARTFVCGVVLVTSSCWSLWGLIKADDGILIKYPLPYRWIK